MAERWRPGRNLERLKKMRRSAQAPAHTRCTVDVAIEEPKKKERLNFSEAVNGFPAFNMRGNSHTNMLQELHMEQGQSPKIEPKKNYPKISKQKNICLIVCNFECGSVTNKSPLSCSSTANPVLVIESCIVEQRLSRYVCEC